jgi:antitoxin SocA-like protein
MKARRTIRPSNEKFRELILLIAEWCQSDPRFGATKLNKLLYHADFSSFLTNGVPITGQEYFALPQGPAPRRLKPITESMKKKEEELAAGTVTVEYLTMNLLYAILDTFLASPANIAHNPPE